MQYNTIQYNRAYSVVANKDDLTKENVRIKPVLKKNGFQTSIISNITITAYLSQNNKHKPQISKKKILEWV